MSIRFYIGIFLLVVLSSCEPKEFPVETIGEPEFIVEGKLGGQTLDLAAGNGFFLDTEVEIHDNGSGIQSAIFVREDCMGCEEQFEFQFYTTDAAQPAENGPLDFFSFDEETGVELTLDDTGFEDTNIIWNFNGNIFNDNSVTISTDQINSFSLTLDSFGGLAGSSISYFSPNTLDCGESFENPFFNLEFETEINPSGFPFTLIITPPEGTGTNEQITWLYGPDQSLEVTSTGPEQFIIPMIDPLNLIEFDFSMIRFYPNGDLNYEIFVHHSNLFFEGNDFLANLIDIDDVELEIEVNAIALIYTDRDGNIFSTSGHCSNSTEQPTDSYFNISNALPNEDSPNGLSTIKLDIESQATLYPVNNSLDALLLTDFVSTIAVPFGE